MVTLQVNDETGQREGFREKERRLSPRVDCEGFAEAFAIDEGYLFRGQIRDISQTGCYIMTNARLRLERLTEVDLDFMLNKRKYHTLARVMGVRPGKGVGLRFLFSDSRAEEAFKGLFQTVVDDPRRNKLKEVTRLQSASLGGKP